eukprot:Hpha_TRINITY_DN14846_c0_g2::TRINITY_DN14846_c0_g2_i1::g.169745::m.169745/K08578/CAPN9; calpain-9
MPSSVEHAPLQPPPRAPGARVVMPEVDPGEWAAEYAEYMGQGGRWSVRDFSRWRIEQAAAFLRLNEVSATPALHRVRFLRLKGLSEQEIEEGLRAAGDVRGELALLDGGINDGSDSEDPAPVAVLADDDPRNLWRVGMMVYMYAGSHTYHLVPLTAADFSRHEDMLGSSLMNSDGSWAPQLWMTAGLKGIVADVFPKESDLREGVDIIAQWPGSQHLKEAVVVTPPRGGLVEVEYAHTSEITRRKVPISDVRTVLHPMVAERQLIEHASRKQKLEETTKATASFPYAGRTLERAGTETGARVPQQSAAAVLLAPEERAALLRESFSDAERYDFAGPLQSVSRYAPLDCETQPSFISTYADFIRGFGEEKKNPPGDPTMPVYPESQQTFSSIGYGFDLSHHRKHNEIPFLFKCNPLIDVCAQCYAKDSCFVDPDFPPSHRSLYGVGDGEVVGAEYAWARLTELTRRPRVTAAASDRFGLRPGAFRNQWLPHVVASIRSCSEFDGIISPNDGALHPFGCYSVRLFIDGQWHFTIIDDFVPVHVSTGEPACLRNASDGECYAALLEKACAKLHGSYSALSKQHDGVSAERMWEDFTGGLGDRAVHALLTAPAAFTDNMQARYEDRRYCLMLAHLHGATAQQKLARTVTSKDFRRFGLEMGGYGIVQDVARIQEPGTESVHDAALILNPFPAPVEEEGVPQPGSAPVDVLLHKAGLPTGVTRALQDRRLEDRVRPGSLWFPFNDYIRFHESLLTLWHFDGLHRAAVTGSFEGKAGGSLFEDEARFFTNPQFALSLVLDRYTNVSSAGFLAAQLALSERRFGKRAGSRAEATRLQLHLFTAPAEADQPLPPDSREKLQYASDLIDLVDDDAAINHPSVFFAGQLKPGRYVLVADVGSTTSTENFTLRVWSNANFTLRALN